MSFDKESYTVSRLARRMRNMLEIEIGECWVEGEISNLRKQSSGHQYFTLKDDKAQLSCAFFKGRAARNKVDLEDGMKVRVFAEVSIYEARGSLQLIIVKVEPVGLGELQAKFEALKAKLKQEGLFDQQHKRPIPAFPRTLAVVTSPTGAAIQDMLNVIRRRAPWVKVLLYPVRVQGAGAEQEIARAIRYLSGEEFTAHPRPETILIGRGGGSLEDLWNFNEEVVARAIADCPVPLISAVGHEIDFTIADFVADLRAPTPSAAAELAVPDGDELQRRLERLQNGLLRRSRQQLEQAALSLDRLGGSAMERCVSRATQDRRDRLEALQQFMAASAQARLTRLDGHLQKLGLRLAANHPQRLQEQRRDRLQRAADQLSRAVTHQLERPREKIAGLAALLRSLGPEQTLARGYSITFTGDGRIVRSPQEAPNGTRLRTHTAGGDLHSTVD